jgi:hypothetical protein
MPDGRALEAERLAESGTWLSRAADVPSLDDKTFENVLVAESDARAKHAAVLASQPVPLPAPLAMPAVQPSPPALQPLRVDHLRGPDVEPQNFTPRDSDSESGDQDKDAISCPDFGDDLPMEGPVNVPVRSKQEKERFLVDSPAEGKTAHVRTLCEPRSPDMVVGDVDDGGRDSPQSEDTTELKSMLVNSLNSTQKVGSVGKDVMDDISGLIAKMPLDMVEELPAAAPFYMPRQPKHAHDYNPLARPTSRWKCRWTTFAPTENSGGMPGTQIRNDHRNPYIRALNTTREELDKSWNLVITEETSATRLASARESALSSMQVTEVDHISEPEGLARLRCMMPPEPCGERCRDGEFADFPVELCDPHQSEAGYSYSGQGMVAIIESDFHRAGEREEVYRAGLNFSPEKV